MPDLLARARTEGMGEPQPRLADSLPHPTDRHPPTLQRIAALGIAADPVLLAQAGRSVQAGDDGFARSLVPDWEALCIRLSQDVIDFAVELDGELEALLEAAAAAPVSDRTEIHADIRGGLWRRGLSSAGLIAVAGSVAAATVRTPGERWPTLLICLGLAVVGLVLAALAVQLRRGARTPYLTLDRAGFTARGLEGAVSWTDVDKVRCPLTGSSSPTSSLLRAPHCRAECPAGAHACIAAGMWCR